MRSFFFVSLSGLIAVTAGCTTPGSDSPDAGTRHPAVGENCGFENSPGNAIGVGRYCTTTDDCPIASSGTTIQCSTVLTDNTLPLLCSRLCGDLGNGQEVDCGPDAVCHPIDELGYSLVVCVPRSCAPLFDGGLP